MRFIPDKVAQGGSLIGNSYLATFAACPRNWFNSYYRPYEGGRGLRSKFISEHLIKGRVFHEGLAALYKSGCRSGEDTGEWDIKLAQDLMHLHHAQSIPEYTSEDKAEEEWIKLQAMLTAYHDEFSLRGHHPDYPTIRVLHDGAGEPLIEREFQVDLGYRDFVFTCRADLVILHHGRPKVMEHKTSAPGMWAKKRLHSIHTDSQFTGECFVLASLFPDEPIDGVLCNVVVKGGRTDVALRESTRRCQADYEVFRLSALDILQQIDHRTQGFESDLTAGWPHEDALARWFPDHGTKTGQCQNYDGCQFQPLCLNKTRTDENLRSFRTRTSEEVRAAREKAK